MCLIPKSYNQYDLSTVRCHGHCNRLKTRIADLELSHVCSKVLMLGAGFVTRPTLDILSEAGIPVTVGMRRILLHDSVFFILHS